MIPTTLPTMPPIKANSSAAMMMAGIEAIERDVDVADGHEIRAVCHCHAPFDFAAALD
jgi:hypothetical protein